MTVVLVRNTSPGKAPIMVPSSGITLGAGEEGAADTNDERDADLIADGHLRVVASNGTLPPAPPRRAAVVARSDTGALEARDANGQWKHVDGVIALDVPGPASLEPGAWNLLADIDLPAGAVGFSLYGEVKAVGGSYPPPAMSVGMVFGEGAEMFLPLTDPQPDPAALPADTWVPFATNQEMRFRPLAGEALGMGLVGISGFGYVFARPVTFGIAVDTPAAVEEADALARLTFDIPEASGGLIDIGGWKLYPPTLNDWEAESIQATWDGDQLRVEFTTDEGGSTYQNWPAPGENAWDGFADFMAQSRSTWTIEQTGGAAIQQPPAIGGSPAASEPVTWVNTTFVPQAQTQVYIAFDLGDPYGNSEAGGWYSATESLDDILSSLQNRIADTGREGITITRDGPTFTFTRESDRLRIVDWNLGDGTGEISYENVTAGGKDMPNTFELRNFRATLTVTPMTPIADPADTAAEGDD